MTLTYKIGISAQEHDHFVKNSPQTNLLQSSQWAQVKNNWKNERIGFYRDGQLVASASILIKPLPLGFTMFYIPRGPVMDYQDQELVAFVLKILKQVGRKKRAVFLKFDPALLLKQYSIQDAQETHSENSDTLSAIHYLQANGCQWSGPTRAISDTIQPRFQANIYTQENQQNTFPKHTKRLMKDALNRGVTTYRGNIKDISNFAAVVALTENRKGVSLRNQEYFTKLMEIYKNDAYLHLAKVNIPQRLAEYQEQLQQIEKDLSDTAEHQKKRLSKLQQQKNSVENYIAEFKTFTREYPDEVIIAGILSISFGNTMEMLYAGMNDDFKKFYPQYLLYPKVFEDAYKDGIIWANMGGVEGSLDDGLTKFKSNFNPTIEEYIGEFTLPVSHLYSLADWAYKLRKKRRSHK